jgi:CBS domain-containing protein
MSLSNLTVGDLMSTAVVTFRPGDLVRKADEQMKAAAIRHLPVVDEHNRVVGILSNRDIAKAMRARRPLPVSKVMSLPVIRATPDMAASEAAQLLLEKKIGSLPVVDEDDTVVGIITETDFLSLIEKLLRGEVPQSIRR